MEERPTPRPPSAEEQEWLDALPETLDEETLRKVNVRQMHLLDHYAALSESQRASWDAWHEKQREGLRLKIGQSPGMKRLGESLNRMMADKVNINPVDRPSPQMLPAYEPPDFAAGFEEMALERAEEKARLERRQVDMVNAMQGVHEELISQSRGAKHSDSVQHSILILTLFAVVAAVAVPVAVGTGSAFAAVGAGAGALLVGLLLAWVLGVFRRHE